MIVKNSLNFHFQLTWSDNGIEPMYSADGHLRILSSKSNVVWFSSIFEMHVFYVFTELIRKVKSNSNNLLVIDFFFLFFRMMSFECLASSIYFRCRTNLHTHLFIRLILWLKLPYSIISPELDEKNLSKNSFEDKSKLECCYLIN